MDDFFEQVVQKGEQANEMITIKFFANGSTTNPVTIPCCRGEKESWKIKKRLLKKLKFKNYKSGQLQSELRIFTSKGIELTDFYVEDLIEQKSLIYSLNEDFDYNVRVNALKFQKHLGKGGFGEVNMCLDELTDEMVAVKYLSFKTKNISNNTIKKEVEALSGLKHKNIVKLLDAVPRAEEQQLIVVMEYLAGGELYEYWKRFPNRQMPEREVAEIMFQLASALEYCHNGRIIHRDMKF